MRKQGLIGIRRPRQNFRLAIFIFFFYFGFPLDLMGQASLRSSSTSLETSIPTFWEKLKWNPFIEVSGGYSSNVPRGLLEKEGVFQYLKGELKASQIVGRVYVEGKLEGEGRLFSESEIANLGDQSGFSLQSRAIWFINRNWELGGDLGVEWGSYKNVLEYFGNYQGEDQRFIRPNGRVYTGWFGKVNSIEVGLFAASEDHQKILIDGPNVYQNDRDRLGIDSRYVLKLSKSQRFMITGVVLREEYHERPADFTEGVDSSPTNPNPSLNMANQNLAIGYDYDGRWWKNETEIIGQLRKDLIYGALDSTSIGITQRFVFQRKGFFKISPRVSLMREKYDHFRSQSVPSLSPTTFSLREENRFVAGVDGEVPISNRLTIKAKYDYNQLRSNLAFESYQEHVAQGSLAVAF